MLRHLTPRKPALYYFVWLLGTLGLMTATGYLLFSGVSGLGDFGTTGDGVFYAASPEWLWRGLLTVLGAVGYFVAVRFAALELAPHLEGAGRARITYARHLVLVTYLTGIVVAVGIGLLNPEGLVIVLISSVASSLGGMSGFLWMMQLIDPSQPVSSKSVAFGRRWAWLAIGSLVTLVYALVLGPTLYL